MRGWREILNADPYGQYDHNGHKSPRVEPGPDLAAVEERAARLEYDEGLPRTEAETQAAAEAGFASVADLHGALCRSWLAGVEAMADDESDRPRGRHIATTRAFLLGGWGEGVLAAGWTELDPFGLHPVARWARLDTMRAGWLAVAPTDITGNDIRLGSGLRPRREVLGATAALSWLTPQPAAPDGAQASTGGRHG